MAKLRQVEAQIVSLVKTAPGRSADRFSGNHALYALQVKYFHIPTPPENATGNIARQYCHPMTAARVKVDAHQTLSPSQLCRALWLGLGIPWLFLTGK